MVARRPGSRARDRAERSTVISPLAIALYDVILFVHIAAVVIAFGTTFAYPLLFAIAEAGSPPERAALHAFQARYGRTYASFGLLVIVLAGAYLATARDLWAEPG